MLRKREQLFDERVFDALANFDTATVCNALEVPRPEYRTRGYTTRPWKNPYNGCGYYPYPPCY